MSISIKIKRAINIIMNIMNIMKNSTFVHLVDINSLNKIEYIIQIAYSSHNSLTLRQTIKNV